MEKHPIIFRTFLSTFAAAVYIFLISQIMQNGNQWFGQKDTFVTPFVVLLLFCLSAAVVGGLVFGYSIWLFINGKKAESIKAAFYSVGWLAVYTVIGLINLAITK